MAPTLTESEIVACLTDGQRALEEGRHRAAALAFARARDATPGVTAIAMMAANAWRMAERVLEEREALLIALGMADRTDVASLYELGTALIRVGAPVEARACFEVAVQHHPQDAAAWSALASATRAAGDPTAAWTCVQRALTLRPHEPSILLTAGQVRHALGDLNGAADWLNRAAAERPGHATTELQRAFTSLLRGANADGWEWFEARRRPALPTGTREWRGEPLAGDSILVLGEQGIGDQFHFARFIRRLHALGASRVVLTCHRSTVALFVASGFDAVAMDDTPPPTTWAVPLLSLPHRLRVGADVAAETVPYLRAPHAPASLPPSSASRKRLGLVWKGNPEFAATVLRDLDDGLLTSLIDFPDVDWVSLQYGQEIPPACASAIAPMPPVRDWEETAGLLSQLDGVVTVDTSMAHLAGAMGLPAWILVPHAPDWRWGLNHETTPWYPSVQLVRQPAPRDWHGAIQRLRAMLQSVDPRRAP